MPIFELSNELKKKAIKPAGRPQSPKFPPKRVLPQTPAEVEKAAQAALSDLSDKFPAWACGDVQKMKEYLAEATGMFDEKRTQFIRQDFYTKAHDLKGQGTTFGYPLITDIAAHICRFITEKNNISSSDLAVLKKDTRFLETVLWKKLKGDGGIKGAQILEELK